MSFKNGQVVGDYEIIESLGAGGMGAVYKAKNLISGRTEAMKVLLPDLCASPDLAERFVNEIKVLARLSHPNIAALHTALRIQNQLLMVMELVEGETLESRVAARPMPVTEAVSATVQVLDALAYAHSRGVIHRDIKPANIALTGEGVVKLLDFGIARSNDNRRLTRTGLVMGSLYYMAPEQVNGRPADARSDLYSVGITLYRLITGRRAIDGQNEFALMRAHVDSIPRAPHEVNSSIDRNLSNAIMRAIAKDPAARFQTAEQFRAELMTVSSSSPASLAETVEQTLSAGSTVYTEALALIQRHLAQALGPIATALVKRESRNAVTLPDLCRVLSEAIPAGESRKAFLDACGRELGNEAVAEAQTETRPSNSQPPTTPWEATTLERCARSLAAYVGPLAKVIVARAAKKARSIDELYLLVSVEIGDEADRQEFVASRSR